MILLPVRPRQALAAVWLLDAVFCLCLAKDVHISTCTEQLQPDTVAGRALT